MEFHSKVYADGKGPTYGYSPEGCLSRRSWARGIVTDYAYDAWGNVLDEVCTVPALATLRYRFQGREWSAATGLVNFRMRWYDPETGRWLSKDPIGLSGGLNLYAFCGNDPISFIDPLGWCSEDDASTSFIDWFQMGLDGIGLIDPTFVSDGTNALIYLFRGKYRDALTTVVGIVPYIGDLAKGGKYIAKGAKGCRNARTGYKTTKEAARAAAEHGRRDTGEIMHGQKVFSDGKFKYTRDIDSHIGGAWKRFDRSGNRTTLDMDLNPIGK